MKVVEERKRVKNTPSLDCAQPYSIDKVFNLVFGVTWRGRGKGPHSEHCLYFPKNPALKTNLYSTDGFPANRTLKHVPNPIAFPNANHTLVTSTTKTHRPCPTLKREGERRRKEERKNKSPNGNNPWTTNPTPSS